MLAGIAQPPSPIEQLEQSARKSQAEERENFLGARRTSDREKERVSWEREGQARQ
jgi:hypothetical protein